MTKPPSILAFAGSLRKDSYNKKILDIVVSGARDAGAKVTIIDLKDYPLPIYNQEDEDLSGLPKEALALKQLMREHEGFIIASPEYNSSISGVLKNMIDWVSRKERPEETYLESFNEKCAVICSASPGGLGGLRGLVHLRAILGNINVVVLPAQETLSQAHVAFDSEGNLTDENKKSALQRLGKNLTEMLMKISSK